MLFVTSLVSLVVRARRLHSYTDTWYKVLLCCGQIALPTIPPVHNIRRQTSLFRAAAVAGTVSRRAEGGKLNRRDRDVVLEPSTPVIYRVSQSSIDPTGCQLDDFCKATYGPFLGPFLSKYVWSTFPDFFRAICYISLFSYFFSKYWNAKPSKYFALCKISKLWKCFLFFHLLLFFLEKKEEKLGKKCLIRTALIEGLFV